MSDIGRHGELMALALKTYDAEHAEVARSGVPDRIKALVADGDHLVTWTHAACMDAVVTAVSAALEPPRRASGLMTEPYDQHNNDDSPEPVHRTEWAVLSGDGQVYEVHKKARGQAGYEASVLAQVERGVKLVERRCCSWSDIVLHEPDAIDPVGSP